VTARRAIAAPTASLAVVAVVALVGAGGAGAASGRSVDGRPAAAVASVHPLDGHPAAAVASVHPLDGRPAAAAPSVRLTVDFTRRPGAPHEIAHVQCGGSAARADGFLSRVGGPRACAQARRIARLLAGRPDPHRACSQIYGGPERALVTGTIGAQSIRHGFSRTNGCGIADWRRAMPLLPRPG